MPDVLPIRAVVCGLLIGVSNLQPARAASILTADAPPPVATLGVRTHPLPRPTTNAMDVPLPGVQVTDVDPTGPTAATLQPHDIIQQINAQILFNPPQLHALLQTLRPGETVTMWRVRGGTTQTLAITLGAASTLEDPTDRAADDVNRALAPDGAAWDSDTRLPATLDPEQVTSLMHQIREAYEAAIPHDRLDDEREAELMEEIRRRLENSQLEPPTSNPDDYRRRQYATHVPDGDRNTMTEGSGEGSITVTDRDGAKFLIVRDSKGIVLFEGPVETLDGRSQLPPAIWRKYYNIERRGQIDADIEDLP